MPLMYKWWLTIFFMLKTAILAWITFATALVNVVLNYIFISFNGAIGAAQATTLTLHYLCGNVAFSNKAYKMPWMLKKMSSISRISKNNTD